MMIGGVVGKLRAITYKLHSDEQPVSMHSMHTVQFASFQHHLYVATPLQCNSPCDQFHVASR